jgi:hypothetical protein
MTCKYVGTLPSELPDDSPHDPRLVLVACLINQQPNAAELWPAVAEYLWNELRHIAKQFAKTRPRIRATRAALWEAVPSETALTAGAILAAVPKPRKAGHPRDSHPAWAETQSVVSSFEQVLRGHSRTSGYDADTEAAITETWDRLRHYQSYNVDRRQLGEFTPRLRKLFHGHLRAGERPHAVATFLASVALNISEDTVEMHMRHRYPKARIELPPRKDVPEIGN